MIIELTVEVELDPQEHFEDRPETIEECASMLIGELEAAVEKFPRVKTACVSGEWKTTEGQL